MKYLHTTRIRAAVLAGAACLLLAGCGREARLFGELTATQVQEWEAGERITQTQEMLGLSAMREVAQNGGLTLYYNDKTTEIAVKTAEGTVWYSNPQDRLTLDQAARGRYSSPVLVNVIDSAETTRMMTSMEECVAYGQAKAEAIENGVRVVYHFGRVTHKPAYPQVLTAGRFQELLASLTEAEQNNMKRYYIEVNYSTVADAQTRKRLKEMYAHIEEVERLYSLKSSVSALEAARLNEYFEKAAYTYEQRENDHALVGYTEEDKSYGNFILPVAYTLQNGQLLAAVDTEGIRCTENIKLDSVLLLPYLNTAEGAKDSQAVIPDGSGALIGLSKIRSGSAGEYNEPLYGQDYALFQSNNTSHKYRVSFPLYGILTEQGAVMAAAVEGDATASLSLTPRTSENARASIALQFKLLNYAQVKLMSTDTDTVNSYAEQAIGDPVQVAFTFLDSGHNRWIDVAQRYRQMLRDSGGLAQTAAAPGQAAVVRLLGAIDDKEPIAGIPCEVIRPLTTFEQAASIAGELTQALDGVPLVFRYSGWQKGGVKSPVQTAVKAEGKLGGNAGLEALRKTLAQQEIPLYPDADFQYVYRDSLADGFNRKRDSVQFITREYAYKPIYNIANFLPEASGRCGYLLRSEAVTKNLAAFLQAAGGSGLESLCLPYMASDLSSNFDRKAFETRNAARGQAASWLRSIRDSGYGVMAEGANAYSLFALDWAVDLPMEANRHGLIDETIPFVQMTLSGSVSYAATALNEANNDRYYTLKCIETGSSPYITAMWAENAAVKGTDYDGWYAANFAGLKTRLVTVAAEISRALKPADGSAMCDYLRLSDGVVQVNYDNGAAILLNYTDQTVQTVYGSIGPHGWLNAEWR